MTLLALTIRGQPAVAAAFTGRSISVWLHRPAAPATGLSAPASVTQPPSSMKVSRFQDSVPRTEASRVVASAPATHRCTHTAPPTPPPPPHPPFLPLSPPVF